MPVDKKIYLSYEDVTGHVTHICREITLSGWTPDIIVAVGRGGSLPGAMLSHYFNVPFISLDVSLRDFPSQTSNCWLPDSATNGEKILIVDDMNDSGATFNWIVDDWKKSVGDKIKWFDTVRFAALVENLGSAFNNVQYTSMEISKKFESVWITFPWEEWWKPGQGY